MLLHGVYNALLKMSILIDLYIIHVLDPNAGRHSQTAVTPVVSRVGAIL